MGSSYGNNHGRLYFGGINGFNAFDPEQITDNLFIPPIVITNFQLSGEDVPISGNSVLHKSILDTEKIILSHKDRVFSFEFAALNYQAPEKNRYKYIMEGFDHNLGLYAGRGQELVDVVYDFFVEINSR